MKTQDSRRSRAPSSRGGWIPRQPGALTLVDFDPPNSEVMEQFPCVVDATTTRGLAALCKALPDRWEVAIKKGRASLPKPTAETTLKEVLERGSERILPGGPHDATQRAGATAGPSAAEDPRGSRRPRRGEAGEAVPEAATGVVVCGAFVGPDRAAQGRERGAGRGGLG